MSFLGSEIAAEKGRVTQGLPSLLPEKRASISYQQKQRAKSDGMVKDAEAKQDQAKAPDGRRPRTDKQAAGTYLQPDEMMRRLTILSKKLYFERSIHDSARMGIYLLTSDPEHPKRYLAAYHCNQPIPEFTVLKTISADRTVPTLMGWRNVLLRLMKERVIGHAQTEVMFGPPGMQSKNWQAFTSCP